MTTARYPNPPFSFGGIVRLRTARTYGSYDPWHCHKEFEKRGIGDNHTSGQAMLNNNNRSVVLQMWIGFGICWGEIKATEKGVQLF